MSAVVGWYPLRNGAAAYGRTRSVAALTDVSVGEAVRTASYTVDPVIEEVVKVLPPLLRDLVNLAAGPKLAQGLVGRPRLPAHHPEARHPRAEPRYR